MSANAEIGLGPILQVFISSSTKEMEAYRTAAIRAINEAGMLHKNYNDASGAGFTQGDRTIFQLNREIVQHSDVFVGLYGFGEVWKPASHPGLRSEHPELLIDPEKLIMEYEYEWAREAGLYLFPFVRTDETVDVPWCPMHPRMDRLRSRVMAGTVGWLTTANAFYTHCLESLRAIRPRVFLSYARVDADPVAALQRQLRSEDIHVWRDETNIPGGADWAGAIEAAIQLTDAMILVLTRESAISEWVKKECIAFIESGKTVVPYLYDPDVKSKLPGYVSTLQYVDGTAPEGFRTLVKRLRGVLGVAKGHAGRG